MEGAELNLDHANADLKVGDALPKRSPRRGSSVRQIRWTSDAGRHRDRGVALAGAAEAIAGLGDGVEAGAGLGGLVEVCGLAGRGEAPRGRRGRGRSEEHTSELQSLRHLVCRL